MSDDQDAVTEEAAETDSRKLTLANGCTMVLIRAVYDSGETVPTIRVFGFDGSHKRAQNLNANPMNLPDSDGNIAITLAKLATDVKTEAGRLATEPVQVDVKGSSSIVALVASTGAGTAGVTLEAKVL
jgi:hypothetical protein